MRAVAATASERQESERTEENERDHRESQPAVKPKLDEPRKMMEHMMVEMMMDTRRVCMSTSRKQKRQG